MQRLFRNDPNKKDYVRGAFLRLAQRSRQLYLAAPYFNYSGPVLEAATSGRLVQLLIGLNGATSPRALAEITGLSGVSVRYFTDRFHAKLYVFDDAVLIGSANLTDAGMQSNREGVICFEGENDGETIEEVRALFAELWNDADVLTNDKLNTFTQIIRTTKPQPDVTAAIEAELGRTAPKNVDVTSRKVSRERLFMEGLRRKVYEEYRPAFAEVQRLLSENNLHRPELLQLGAAHATNRFLNWVRQTQAEEDAWDSTPLRGPAERQAEIVRLGQDWTATSDTRVVPEYTMMLNTVQHVFASDSSIKGTTKADLSAGLVALHAFLEQVRFVKGGRPNLAPTFWSQNQDDEGRVKKVIGYLLFGRGDFIQRLHDCLYDRNWKLSFFGLFCALELYGTVKPQEFPPINGRMAKALRYIGFEVKGT